MNNIINSPLYGEFLFIYYNFDKFIQNKTIYTITAVEKPRGRQRVWTIVLENDRCIDLDKDVIRHYGISKGRNFSSQEWKEIKNVSARKIAKDFALDYLGNRARSEKELRQRLRSKRVRKELIVEIVEDLRRIGLLNDRKFSKAFAEDLLNRKGVGSIRMRMELKQRGIPDETAEEVVTEIYEKTDNTELIRRCLKKKTNYLQKIDDPKVKQKLYQYLIRQGFSWADVKDVISQYGVDYE